MNSVERAVCLFEEGFSCSQAVLAAFGPQWGLGRETGLKIAAPFGGGISRMGGLCGAVTGAFMVIGLKGGHTRAEDQAVKEATYDLVHEFVRRFEARHGSLVCRDLLGWDLSLPDQRERARAEGLFSTRCPGFVRDAAEILAQILGPSR